MCSAQTWCALLLRASGHESEQEPSALTWHVRAITDSFKTSPWIAAGVDGGKVEGGAAMTSSNPVYKRRRLDISPPQPQVSACPYDGTAQLFDYT